MRILESKRKSFKERLEIPIDKNSIDLTPLEKAVKKLIGILPKLSITKINNNEYIEVSDQTNYASKAGILSYCFESLKIETSNSKAFLSDGKSLWAGKLNFRYKAYDGGSNGQDLVYFWYDFDTEKWTFKDNQYMLFKI